MEVAERSLDSHLGYGRSGKATASVGMREMD